jgi:DNA-binding Lrp family transcriptional regulator
MDTTVNETDARLVDVIQRDFPLTSRPFDALGERLGIAADEIIERIARLKSAGIIRQISAIFDSSALGYNGALVAFRVDPGALDAVAADVSGHSGVSHCYARDAVYNLWFTMTLPPERDLHSEVEALARRSEVLASLVLPALRVFKIGVFLPMSDEAVGRGSPVRSRTVSSVSALSCTERAAVRALQGDLPLVDRPFDALGRAEGLTERQVLDYARRFLDTGAMRRFAAVLRHTSAGYRSNAMVCWQVPSERVEQIGFLFASDPAVSHCYERLTFPDWPYPLYTMIHARTGEQLLSAIQGLERASGVSDYLVLRSLREYKKSRVSYFKESGNQDA